MLATNGKAPEKSNVAVVKAEYEWTGEILGLNMINKRTGKCFAVGALWACWCTMHVHFCWQVLADLEGASDFDFKNGLIWLALLNLAVLLQVLRSKGRPKDGSERLLGLVGSFILGITPLGLAFLGFATTLADVRETLREKIEPLDLTRYHAKGPENLSFFLGLDISKSALPRTAGRVDALCGALERMLTSDDLELWPQRPPIALTARVFAWQFATKSWQVDERGPKLGDSPKDAFVQSLCNNLRIAQRVSGEETAYTDIIGFLEKIAPEVDKALEK
jgi:hypothetical protein